MSVVKIVITTTDGEVLSVFEARPTSRQSIVGEIKLSDAVRELIENNFEVDDD